MERSLTKTERAAVENWLESGNQPEQRRAQIVLLASKGCGTGVIAEKVGLSPRQVRRWLAAFRTKRLGIFPELTAQGQLDEGDRSVKPDSPAEATGGTEPETGERQEAAVVVPAIGEAATQGKSGRAPQLLDFGREVLSLPELPSPGLLPDDPMSEAGRKTLWFHFLRMIKHEPGTRAGKDIEELHDMRVATRRMRAAIRVFGDYFEPQAINPFRKGIRRVTRALGPVRDLDVFEEKAERYLKGLPESVRDSLAPLLDTWRAEREAARDKMIAFLDSDQYRRFKEKSGEFLQLVGSGARPIPRDRPTPYQVRHIAPRLIYTRYETVRAYETILDGAQIETLHALRIDCKYLRYTLEFLREVLGPEGEAVIKEVKALQDHLGDLNDADVAIRILNDFLKDWDSSETGVPLHQRRSVEGVVTYLAARHAEKHRILTTFPTAWDRLNRYEVRRWLALAVAEL